MNSNIKNSFKKSKAYIGYLTCGDGGVDRTFDAAMALVEGGVTMLELGVAFSDPVADGPVIARASSRALSSGTNLNEVLKLSQKIRQYSSIPLILFSYLNPILQANSPGFFSEMRHAGIDGLLLVDCPIEENDSIRKQCLKENIDFIHVITPNTDRDRLKKIEKKTTGFLYYACRKGTTGIRSQLPENINEKMAMIKSIVKLPVVVGFGLSTIEETKAILEYADGVVVGSLFVRAIEEGKSAHELSKLSRSINPFERSL